MYLHSYLSECFFKLLLFERVKREKEQVIQKLNSYLSSGLLNLVTGDISTAS